MPTVRQVLHPGIKPSDEGARALRSARGMLIAGGALLLAVASSPAWSAPDQTAELARPTMNQIFESIRLLLPEVVDADRFADPAKRDFIEAQLAQLARATDQLELHGREAGPSFLGLSLSLAESANRAQEQFVRGRVEDARLSLLDATHACIGCHSRKQSARRFPLAERLTDGDWMKQLTPFSTAHVYVLVRRFDEALSAWERAFADPELLPTLLDFSGSLVDYLTIAVRGTREYARAYETMLVFSRRPDLPTYLRTLVEEWTSSLAALEREKRKPATLAHARELIERSRTLTLWPEQRGGLVYALAASGVLSEIADVDGLRVARGDASAGERSELAEALYLLGLVEMRTDAAVWVSQARFNLAASIRTEPQGPFAQQALSLLEEDVLRRWGTLRGDALPPRVSALLAELAALVSTGEADKTAQ